MEILEFQRTSKKAQVAVLVSLREKLNNGELKAIRILLESVPGTKATTHWQEIEFGDFNEEEQDMALLHWEEVTTIGLHNVWVPINKIKEIWTS